MRQEDVGLAHVGLTFAPQLWWSNQDTWQLAPCETKSGIEDLLNCQREVNRKPSTRVSFHLRCGRRSLLQALEPGALRFATRAWLVTLYTCSETLTRVFAFLNAENRRLVRFQVVVLHVPCGLTGCSLRQVHGIGSFCPSS